MGVKEVFTCYERGGRGVRVAAPGTTVVFVGLVWNYYCDRRIPLGACGAQ